MGADKGKVLVTGGTGFIGSHTVVQLLGSGFDVVIADNLSNSRVEVVESVEKITGIRPLFELTDLCDREKTMDLFTRHEFTGVIHFAAKKLVGESVEQPLEYYRNNIGSLLNIIGGCLESGVRDLVFSSSCTVYGQPDVLPASEDLPIKQAESPYGNTKIIAEEILQDVTKATGLRVVSLRYFNPVGAHESALIGEYPLNKPSNLMPVITQSAIGKIGEFAVFGDDYDTPDGTCIRDYIHVIDVADAHIEALRYMNRTEDLDGFTTFNLGTGTGISVLEMIRAFEEVNGVKLNYSIRDRRPGDVEKVYASIEKANKILGWKAERTLQDMVSSAWKWEQQLARKAEV